MPNPAIDAIFARRYARRRLLALGGSAGAVALLVACGSSPSSSSKDSAEASGSSAGAATGSEGETGRPAGWTDESHGKDADPDFARVFPAAKVNTLEISVPAATWEAMIANATTLLGTRGVAGQEGQAGGAVRGGGGGPPAGAGQLPGAAGGRGGGPGNFTSVNPDWFPATIAFDGRTWTNVGFRFKGNSSLSSSWRSGTDKIPFKLDFDQFEGDYPEIKDQRFWGFKQLSLSNNVGDTTSLRETIAYDLFESAGLVGANTAAYEIVLDRGAGKTSLGMYTVIEVIDDTVIDRSFTDGSGNIYEAEGSAASFAAGTDSQIEASFQAEGGENPDWSDVRALYTAINAGTRSTDPAAWRKGLESIFDVDTFLEWLGLATTIQHWDTYGGMSHNYYLYNDPSTKKLTWISWDHNFVLGASMGMGGAGQVFNGAGQPPNQNGQAPAFGANGQLPAGGLGGRAGGPGGLGSTSFDKADVTADWPLIRYMFDQPEYVAKYKTFLRDAAAKTFVPEALIAKYQPAATAIKAALPETERAAYQAAWDSLGETLRTRAAALKTYLETA